MSGYHVYRQSCGHENVENSSYFVFAPDDSKQSIIVWTKYLSAFEKSRLAFLESDMDYWVLNHH